MDVSQLCNLANDLQENIGKQIFGKDDIITKMLVCLFCGGHILLEDIPGTGKTTLAKSLAQSLGCDFKRIQFTPDLLPSDLTGLNFFSQKESNFVFKRGAIFTNILLGDEINRATPKTQSSLLECMEERQVTVDGTTYPLEGPFLVIATQNPVEIQGTFPLPEAQLDRFFMQLAVGYPDFNSERTMLESNISKVEDVETKRITDAATIRAAQDLVRNISISKDILTYMVNIVKSSREDERVRLGVSPRGTIALMRASQGMAAISGRDYVIPDDVKSVAADVMSHRIIIKGFAFSQSNLPTRELVDNILNEVPVPTEFSMR